jgi:predicted O-methyltransferase YrrM
MSEQLWTKVDAYLCDLLAPSDPALDDALAASAAAGLPAIQVAPNQGKLLHLLARIIGARRILEIGTLGGYSTIWLARALPPEGRLVTLEADPKHAKVARANFVRAGVDRHIDLRLGLALDALKQISAEGVEPFDLVFIDADKANIPTYFRLALDLTRRGGLIIVDNVIRKGTVIDADSVDPDVRGIRLFNELVAGEPRVSATAIQTVGGKGYDGFALAMVTADP